MPYKLLLLALVFLCSCSNKDKIKLDGKIDNAQTESKIYLYEQQVGKSKILDSAILSSNGKFKFRIKASEPRFYLLRIENSGAINLLLSPREKLVLTADASDLISSASVSGSSGTKLILELDQKHNRVLQHLDSIIVKYKRIKDMPTARDQITLLENDFNNSKLQERKNIIGFIVENYKSMASIMALYLKFDTAEYVLEIPRDLQYYKIASDTLIKMYPASKDVKALKADFDKMLKMHKAEIFKNMIKNSKVSIPEIALPDAKGDTIRITSLLGKIILLSFWSSESRLCLMNNRDYLNLYKKYKKSGFVIYQVSVDSDKNKWLAGIKELPWISVAEITKDVSYSASLYNVTEIPASFLIDQKGGIIGKNYNATDLDRFISSLIKK